MPITQTNFNFPNQTKVYHGKVRDVYTIDNKLLVMVASDRISAFDVILPRPIPYKGQVLNQIALHFMQATQHLVPNWVLASPDPQRFHPSMGTDVLSRISELAAAALTRLQ